MKTKLIYNLTAASLIGAAVLLPVAAKGDTVSVPEFRLRQMASVWDRLPQPAPGDSIMPVEQTGIDRGGAIYRTRVRRAIPDSATWIIDEPNGRLLFFADGVPVGEIDSRKGVKSIKLPPMPELAVMEIYADASDPTLTGPKGITHSVSYVQAPGDTTVVADWRVIPVPMDFAFVSSRAYGEDALPEGPAYYKGSFTLPEGASTFLNLSKWNRGTVWLNGREAGSFDTSGGVKTLHLREDLTTAGENSLIIFDIKGPAVARVSCSDREIVSSASAGRGARSLDPDMIVAEGEGSAGGSPVEITLPFPVSTRYIAVEFTGRADAETALAEVKAIGPGINSESRRLWKVSGMSGETPDNPASDAIDSDTATAWHAPASPSQWLIIDLGTQCSITDLVLIPAAASPLPAYRIYAF